MARGAAVGYLVASLCSFGVAVGTYRWARSLPGELGFGGVIFIFPMLIGVLAGVGFAWKSLLAWIDDLDAATADEASEGPRHREPDADAVQALRAHGALPPAAAPSARPRTVPADLVVGLGSLAGGLLFWWTDPVGIFRQLAIALAAYGAIQIAAALWRAGRRTRR
jgi:hypothetical protein